MLTLDNDGVLHFRRSKTVMVRDWQSGMEVPMQEQIDEEISLQQAEWLLETLPATIQTMKTIARRKDKEEIERLEKQKSIIESQLRRKREGT